MSCGGFKLYNIINNKFLLFVSIFTEVSYFFGEIIFILLELFFEGFFLQFSLHALSSGWTATFLVKNPFNNFPWCLDIIMNIM